MEYLLKFKVELAGFIDSRANLLVENDKDLFNIKQMEAREQLISELNNLVSGLESQLNSVKSVLESAREVHENDIKNMDSTIKRLKHEKENPWSMAKTRSKTRIVTTARTQYVPPLPNSRQSKILFGESLSLGAIRVQSFDDVQSDGNLYYIDPADHFAFKLNGRLFHGNIGVIYTDEKTPEKIKYCKFAGSCVKQDTCDYYHDPKQFPGSRDHRNFVASSWLYTPQYSTFKNRQQARRFGSRNSLDTDIVGLQSDEVSRFKDQMVHDVLCSLLLEEAYSGEKIK